MFERHHAGNGKDSNPSIKAIKCFTSAIQEAAHLRFAHSSHLGWNWILKLIYENKT